MGSRKPVSIFHDGGLARAIVPKQSDDLSRADLKGDLIDRSQTTVGSAQCFNADS